MKKLFFLFLYVNLHVITQASNQQPLRFIDENFRNQLTSQYLNNRDQVDLKNQAHVNNNGKYRFSSLLLSEQDLCNLNTYKVGFRKLFQPTQLPSLQELFKNSKAQLNSPLEQVQEIEPKNPLSSSSLIESNKSKKITPQNTKKRKFSEISVGSTSSSSQLDNPTSAKKLIPFSMHRQQIQNLLNLKDLTERQAKIEKLREESSKQTGYKRTYLATLYKQNKAYLVKKIKDCIDSNKKNELQEELNQMLEEDLVVREIAGMKKFWKREKRSKTIEQIAAEALLQLNSSK